MLLRLMKYDWVFVTSRNERGFTYLAPRRVIRCDDPEEYIVETGTPGDLEIVEPGRCYPLPLSPELLENNGFQRIENLDGYIRYRIRDGLAIGFPIDKKGPALLMLGAEKICPCNYVHNFLQVARNVINYPAEEFDGTRYQPVPLEVIFSKMIENNSYL